MANRSRTKGRAICVSSTSSLTALSANEDLDVYYPRLARDGWECLEHRKVTGEKTVHVWAKTHHTGYRLIKEAYAGTERREGVGCYWDEYAIETDHRRPMPGVDWADFDQKGHLVFTREGCLYWGQMTAVGMSESLIADFNDEEPDAIASPASARRW